MSATYKVLGMTCGGCASSVIKAVDGAATGAQTSVNLEQKTITVEGEIDASVIEAAVTGAGFEYAGPA